MVLARRFLVIGLVLCLAVILPGQALSGESYQFISKWGTAGTGDGQFDLPWGVALDAAGNVYVVDSDNSRVQKFKSDGTFMTKWGSLGTGNSQFNWPRGIAVDSARNAVYVADNPGGGTNVVARIEKFTLDGTYTSQWGANGTGNGQFSWPVGVATDSEGNVYVVDEARIQKFSSDGTYVTQWGSLGSGYSQFSAPHGIAVDKLGNVFVADSGNNRIQKFSSIGQFIAQWGAYGTGDGQLSGPRGVAVDASGNVYVTDTFNNRIQKFVPGTSDAHYEFAAKWGSMGSGDGQFSNPRGIAVDASGNVYVADEGNNRIQKFAPDTSIVTVGDLASISSTACNDTTCVALGVSSTGTPPNVIVTTKIYVSSDLSSWTEKNSIAGGFSGSLTLINNNFVAALYSYDKTAQQTTLKMISSADSGNTWTQTYSDTLTGSGVCAITKLNNTFVGILQSYDNTTTTAKILFSSDGQTWVLKRTESLSGQGGASVTFGNNTFVASTYVADSSSATTLKIYTSSDSGSTWNQKYTGTLSGLGGIGVMYNNNTFVAYTSASIVPPPVTGPSSAMKLLSSTDNGETWQEQYTETFTAGGALAAVSLGNNIFVVGIVSSYDASSNTYTIKTLTSPNGTTWTSNPQTSLSTPPRMQFLNNTFVAYYSKVSYVVLPYTYATEVFFSNDGATWEKKYSEDSTFNLKGVNYCSGSYIAYGTKEGKGIIKKLSLGGGGGGTPTQYTLTVTKSGTGTGTVSATGLTCSGNTCTGQYDSAAQVTLSASAATGSTFAGWSGSGCSGTGTCSVTMDAAKSVTATFNTSGGGTAKSGTVWAWGDNSSGQIGDGTYTNHNAPVQLNSLEGFIAVAAGNGYSMALKSDGTVWTWGWNFSGKLGDGTTTSRNTPAQVSGLTSVVAIAGYDHSLALKSDGTVWAWGSNMSGKLGDGTTTDRYTPVHVSGLSGIIAIAAGEHHSVALKSDGTVWAWGNNGDGRLGDGTNDDRYTPVQVSGLSGVSAIASRYDHSLALKSDGTVWAWGNNGDGRLGDGTIFNRNIPVQASGLSGVKAIAAGNSHSIALKTDGTVWAWGYYFPDTSNTPVQISGLSEVSGITAGFVYTLAFKQDGTLWAWGWNNLGQLGVGTTIGESTVAQVSGLSNAIAISAGTNHTLAIVGAQTGSQLTLTVTKSGTGTGTVSTTGLTCSGTTCTGTYDSGVQVTLTAQAGAASTFAGWSGSGCSGTGTCAVTMDAAKSVTATFNASVTAQYSITVSVKDLADESAIQGATVTAKDEGNNVIATQDTDSAGTTVINITTAGFYSVKASKTGYSMQSAPQLVELTDANKTSTATIYLYGAGQTTSLPLVQGWNFISFAKQPSNTAIATVLADISSNVRIVWGYNNQTQDWLKYRPSASGNSLTVLESGKGYWIYMNDVATLSMTGWAAPNTTVHLYEDWNLAGYAGNGAAISTAFSGFANKWDIVWTWDAGMWSAKHATLTNLTGITPLTSFSQGKAYWIKMKPGQATDWVQ